jgi:hypothetical protein
LVSNMAFSFCLGLTTKFPRNLALGTAVCFQVL